MTSAIELAFFDNFSDTFINPISNEFEIYEQLASDMTHGIVMPRNQEGYDVLAGGYKYQVKYSNESKSKGGALWIFHFRLTQSSNCIPDFCIFYGLKMHYKKRNSESLYIHCFLIPYEKVLKEMSFGHRGEIEGKINAATGNRSWIWDWELRDYSYESFILRRNELDRYRQLLLISDNAK